MKNIGWPENNAVRKFRYYQKRTAMRNEPDKKFGIEIYGCTREGERLIHQPEMKMECN
ncbi:hypothetical protein MLA66_003164 [Salmonella enterica]|nr:hypothetical protein [Salmonella enterica]EEM7113015.1 hypothetical protein [Salmonella enterica subsp. enterica serovar Poona]HBI5523279.1 hypothetical protein [Salmonella enterica subsp. enterica serovar Welikade]EEH1290789.1 hypothetical protein [Salmonella enterica]EEO3564756.1 hypothetical protein [Salmonella enterica subsp. enterica serovar Poona]